eukprot:TRINITY_DN1304_c0_g1_i1.p2 TRINITY_DN1304_c0_g1~~TRINITY_DN1304_c0_g1_i1.p2  ORF type:complete len:100 (-),score=10.32 TRINITY_DN1304_c0_g1_i1:35-334(-)
MNWHTRVKHQRLGLLEHGPQAAVLDPLHYARAAHGSGILALILWVVGHQACTQWMCEEDVQAGNPWGNKGWRHYSYEDRDDAKKAGCKWDAAARSWYMP